MNEINKIKLTCQSATGATCRLDLLLSGNSSSLKILPETFSLPGLYEDS